MHCILITILDMLYIYICVIYILSFVIISYIYICFVYNSVTAYARFVLLFGYKACMGISSLQLVDIALYSLALFKVRN